MSVVAPFDHERADQKAVSMQAASVQGDFLLTQAVRIALGLPTQNIPAQTELNHAALIQQSHAHCISPYLFEYLETQNCTVSDEDLDRWKFRIDMYRSHYYWRKAHWIAAKKLLNEARVDFAPLKGAAFAFRRGAKPFRIFSDFDVLIRESDVLKLHQHLEKKGFRIGNILSHRFAWHQSLFLKQLRNPNFLHNRQGRFSYYSPPFDIDVHWAPQYRIDKNASRFNPDFLWHRAQNISEHEYALDPADQFTLVLIHALLDNRLYCLIDLFRYHRDHPNIGDPKKLLFESQAFEADELTRQTHWKHLQRLIDALNSDDIQAIRDKVQRQKKYLSRKGKRKKTPLIARSWLQRRLSETQSLTPKDRFLFWLGFLFPSQDFHPEEGLIVRCLLFYSSQLRSLKRYLLPTRSPRV